MLVSAQLPTAAVAALAPAGSTLDGLVGYWPFDEAHGDRDTNLVAENGGLFRSTGDAAARDVDWAASRFGTAIRRGKGSREPTRELESPRPAVAWVKLEDAQQAGLPPASKARTWAPRPTSLASGSDNDGAGSVQAGASEASGGGQEGAFARRDVGSHQRVDLCFQTTCIFVEFQESGQ